METTCPATLTSTPVGTGIGFRPIRDMRTPLRYSDLIVLRLSADVDYQTEQSTSPPKPDRLDSLSVIRPFEVEITATPMPFLTLGTSSLPT